MKMNKYFDTSSLLLLTDSLFEQDCNIFITSVTLNELEYIKTSSNKDQSIKYSARQLLHVLDENQDKWNYVLYNNVCQQFLDNAKYEITNDTKILAAAWYDAQNRDNCVFVTNDIALKMLAKAFFTNIESVNINNDTYKGYENLYLNDEEMANFYSYPEEYSKVLKINQYLNIYEKETLNRVDTLCWTGDEFRPLKYKTFYSKWLGDVKPFKGDIYQAIAADSLLNNKITMIKGPAGSGKSTLALGYLFSLLEKGKINKIIVFCNTVATKNAAKLGFYPGDREEKLMDSQIGNFLISKLGGRIEVERLLDEEKLILLPMSDIRGYDTSGMNAGIYITEAQNLDIQLLKLALQRAGEDSIFILDGDIESQVDLSDYEGMNNGLRRASKVFRGQDVYGEITLQKIHRSRIAEIAEQM